MHLGTDRTVSNKYYRLNNDKSFKIEIQVKSYPISKRFINLITEGRALDSIGGGNILRGAHAGSAPRGSLDSIGGGNILRG